MCRFEGVLRLFWSEGGVLLLVLVVLLMVLLRVLVMLVVLWVLLVLLVMLLVRCWERRMWWWLDRRDVMRVIPNIRFLSRKPLSNLPRYM
jgi:hypothetical protein